jgi:hypothetical protein
VLEVSLNTLLKGIRERAAEVSDPLKKLQREAICFSKEDDMHYAVTMLYVKHLNAGHHLLRSTTSKSSKNVALIDTPLPLWENLSAHRKMNEQAGWYNG